MANIYFKFGIGDKVYIDELQRPGFVLSLYHGEEGSQYKVSYFDEGSKKFEYFSDKEIKLFDDGRRFGFKNPTVTKSPVKIHRG